MPQGELHNEKELLLQIADGDESAFRQLLHFYVPLIEPVIAGIIKSESSVKDVVQEVFFRIWMKREQLPEILVPRDWIFRIVYYQSYSWLRNKKVRENGLLRYSGDDADEDTERFMTLKETQSLVNQAIQNLTPQERKIYLLSREKNMKIAEIATHLNLSPQTVKNTLTRALKNIREDLEKWGVFLPVSLVWFWLP